MKNGAPAQPKPWIVFTAGAMGAGKSRTFSWMSERGIFPLKNVVQIDADLFKLALPEWGGYVQRCPLDAGYHTRKESGYLVEVAQELALRERKHVWVDGSLRDGFWYQQVFRQIKEAHPAYRIAIFHVTASKEAIFERVKRRAAETGRHVPEEEIVDSINRVPLSVQVYRHLPLPTVTYRYLPLPSRAPLRAAPRARVVLPRRHRQLARDAVRAGAGFEWWGGGGWACG